MRDYSASGMGGPPDSLSLSFLVAWTTSSTRNSIRAAYTNGLLAPESTMEIERSTNLDRRFQYLYFYAGRFIEAVRFHVNHLACVPVNAPRVFAIGVLGLESGSHQ